MGDDGMSDLVKRLRANNAYKYTGIVTHAAADRIEMLEREVAASYANQVSLINRVEQLERELVEARGVIDAQANEIIRLQNDLADSRERGNALFETYELLGESCRAAHVELSAEKAAKALINTRRKEAEWEADQLKEQLATEKALADDLDGGLKVAQDLIEAASKLLTKKSGTNWGLWYLDRITELRAAYRKARGL